MKKIIAFFIAIIAVSGCSEDDTINNRNPFVPTYSFSYDINLDLPLYSDLNSTGNAQYIFASGVGTNGVIVFNKGLNDFVAYEASCPNQYLSECSRLEIDGTNVICPCDETTYNLFLGVPPTGSDLKYGLIPYRAQLNGRILRISN